MEFKRFSIPQKEYKGMPFWCWNGKLDKKILLNQLKVFKEMGMGSVFFHSRTGLETPYLEDEWFDLINACAEKTKELDMDAWIYDEDRWPSGTAGGRVTQNPDYRLHFIRANLIPSNEFDQSNLPSDTIAVYCADMDGNEFSNLSLFKGDAQNCNTVLVFSIEQMKQSSNYNGYTYVDTMNESATAEYIKQTHEKYKENCSKHMGKNIVGIFTDEPHRGALMCGFAIDNDNGEFLTPYTKDLFEMFEKRMGYSLKDNLPQLFFFEKGQKFSKVKYDYVEILLQLFIERFVMPTHNWCNKNNLKYTGHMLHEDRLAAQVCMAGTMMRLYEHMDIPGVDVLERNNRNYWIVKQLQSVARQFGKKWLLSEMFGVTGWQTTLEDQKNICDWQLLFGINQRCQHLAWYTMRGEAKRDYPASISSQSYWYKNYSYVEDYFARVSYFRQQGKPVCDVLVINPIESVWGKIYPGWANVDLHATDSNILRMEDEYKQVFYTLLGNGVDFDYGDEEQISRVGSISDGKFNVGQMSYKTVIVPYMDTIRGTTLELLEKFVNCGGKVLVLGNKPEYIDGAQNSELVSQILKDDNLINIGDLAEKVVEYCSLNLSCNNQETLEKLYVQTNTLENGTAYMLLNTDLDNDITFKIGKRKFDYLEKWDARSGKVSLLTDTCDNEIEITLAKGEELLIVETSVSNGYPFEKNVISKKKLAENQESFEYILSEPNVCVLDNARFAIGNEDYRSSTEVLRIDNIIRDYMGINKRGGEMLQPWYRKLFKTDESGVSKRELLKMEFTFDVEYIPKKLELVIESPQQFKIFLNGHIGALQYTDKNWVDNCFSILDIDVSVLKKGKNTILLETMFDEDSNLENIYLLGDFGVNVSGRKVTLSKLPTKLSVGDISKQGFPFYGAGITYLVKCPQISKGNTLTLNFEKSAATGYVISNDKSKQVVAFAPKETDVTFASGKTIKIEYLFTRRNTFGPFHQSPPNFNNCNPNSFRSEDDEYLKDGYVLIEQGMLEPLDFYENSFE